MATKGTLTVRVCAVDGCVKRAIGRGWCAMHYSRWRRHGDVRVPGHNLSRPKPRMPEGLGVPCPYCDGWYVNTRKLTVHCNRLHRSALPVGCPACDRRFLDERGKQTHMGYAHPDLITHRRNDPVVQREWNLRTQYGIGIADYVALLAAQGGTCAGCDATEADEFRGRLHVDHCHETGRVRGLLCARCNRAIGQVKDSAVRLRRLADYVEGLQSG